MEHWSFVSLLTSLNGLAKHRQECFSDFQPLTYCLQHSFNFDIHADPLGAGATMAVCAAIYVKSFDADVGGSQTTVAPPFGRTKQADYWSPGSDGQMRRPGISTNVNLRPLREFVETLQGKTYCPRLAGL